MASHVRHLAALAAIEIDGTGLGDRRQVLGIGAESVRVVVLLDHVVVVDLELLVPSVRVRPRVGRERIPPDPARRVRRTAGARARPQDDVDRRDEPLAHQRSCPVLAVAAPFVAPGPARRRPEPLHPFVRVVLLDDVHPVGGLLGARHAVGQVVERAGETLREAAAQGGGLLARLDRGGGGRIVAVSRPARRAVGRDARPGRSGVAQQPGQEQDGHDQRGTRDDGKGDLPRGRGADMRSVIHGAARFPQPGKSIFRLYPIHRERSTAGGPPPARVVRIERPCILGNE